MKHLPDLLTLRHRRPLLRSSVRSSIRLSTFMSKFDIYVKVSILINYKTKQPSNLAWNISLTSRLCDIGARFSIRLSVFLSACPSVNNSVMSKFDIYVKVSILINYNDTTTIIPCMTHLPDLLTWQVHWPSDLDLYFALHWLTQFTLTFQIFSTIRHTTTKPCIVFLLDVLTQQVPWPGGLDLYFVLQWLWKLLHPCWISPQL